MRFIVAALVAESSSARGRLCGGGKPWRTQRVTRNAHMRYSFKSSLSSWSRSVSSQMRLSVSTFSPDLLRPDVDLESDLSDGGQSRHVSSAMIG